MELKWDVFFWESNISAPVELSLEVFAFPNPFLGKESHTSLADFSIIATPHSSAGAGAADSAWLVSSMTDNLFVCFLICI